MSFYRDIHSQPQANLNLDPESLSFRQSISLGFHEKCLQVDAAVENTSYGHPSHPSHPERGRTPFSELHSCRNFNIRLRRLLLPAIFVFLALGCFLAWSWVNGHRDGISTWGPDADLFGRALASNSTHRLVRRTLTKC